MAHEAIEMGLITGTAYKEELYEKIMFGPNDVVRDEIGEVVEGIERVNAIAKDIKKRTKGFFHYHRVRRTSHLHCPGFIAWTWIDDLL